ncbi:hypothetical protein D3C86_1374960 [compost metagenome]
MHVFEILRMPSLVRSHCNSLRIFLDSSINHFFHRTVVTQVDHLTTCRLNDTAHDIDRCIVSVKQRCCCYNSDIIFGFIGCLLLHVIVFCFITLQR